MSFIHRPSTNTGCYINDPNSNNQGLAFGIVIAAGLSTAIGAIIALLFPFKKGSKNLTLASFLALAAGVMIYVSFVEIFGKALSEFERCFKGDNLPYATLYSTLCFFAGVFITAIFDKLLSIFQNWYFLKKHSPEEHTDPKITDPEIQDEKKKIEEESVDGEGDVIVAAMYSGTSHESSRLIRMGIFTAITLAFHNFPEGLATYISVLDDPQIGASVAIAIAFHNIPEGMCVAMPIYYATGSRIKAFIWAFFSGMTELVGALLGFIVLKSVVTPEIYGVLFGIVGGMMVYISAKELLPTAHKYDPEDKITTISFVVGMGIIALSIVLFSF